VGHRLVCSEERVVLRAQGTRLFYDVHDGNVDDNLSSFRLSSWIYQLGLRLVGCKERVVLRARGAWLLYDVDDDDVDDNLSSVRLPSWIC